MSSLQHVLIVGGGFAGLEVARKLKKAPVRITVVDRSNHHLFQPLLYQVATASLAPSDIAEPIRSLLHRQKNVAVRMAEVAQVDVAGARARLVDVDGGEEWVPYDRLVLACGVSHSYFGHDEWAVHAPGLKTLGDALEIRSRMLEAFERAEWADEDERKALTTFVVIGGGPTGVELAGAIAEIAFWTLRRDFRHIETLKARVILVEAAPDILGAFEPTLRASARAQLERIGVEVRTGHAVTALDAGGVNLGEERIPSATVLWAAGVRGEPVARTLGVPLDRAGRVVVEADCSVPGHPEIFVVGDLAAVPVPEGGKPVPGVAPAAMQMGQFVGSAIAADLGGRPRGTFQYLDKGSLATIGRSKAVARVGPIRTSGFPAWFLWAFVHVLFLVTFRNRFIVMLKWAWAWFTFERAVRLIWRPSVSARRGGS